MLLGCAAANAGLVARKLGRAAEQALREHARAPLCRLPSPLDESEGASLGDQSDTRGSEARNVVRCPAGGCPL